MEKLSIAEIERLRNQAVAEKQKHCSILREIASQENTWLASGHNGMTEEFQLEILERNRQDEVKALLVSFARSDQEKTRRMLSPSFQLKLYDKRNIRFDLVQIMLQECLLCSELEKLLIDAGSPYISDKKSEIGEEYLLNQSLVKHIKDDVKTSFDVIEKYIKQHRLSPSAEELFVKTISSVRSGRDSIIDATEKLLKDYIRKYGELCENAENCLIKSNHHSLIMYYLENSKQSLSYKTSVDLLCERGNKKEVELYFRRFALL